MLIKQIQIYTVINNIKYSVAFGNYNVNNFITSLLSVIPSRYIITNRNITNKLTFTYTTNFYYKWK